MIPKRIAGATRYLGAPKGWEPDMDGPCCHLAVQDAELDGGTPVMVSAWEPTPRELAALNAGNPVYLQVVGSAHPPVMLWVQNASDLEGQGEAPPNA
jgi:hypothetical protein